MGATRMAWRYLVPGAALEDIEKHRRLSKIDHFMQHLSDQEIDELRSRLSENSYGEMVSLDEVLAERRRK